MVTPSGKDARLFYRCAVLRYAEAQVLVRAGHTSGAVYLAGYGVECALKALILAAVPNAARESVKRSFVGNRGHDFEWLRDCYLTGGGARFPAEIMRHLAFVNFWSTSLRYSPASVPAKDSKSFLLSTEAIIQWAHGRL